MLINILVCQRFITNFTFICKIMSYIRSQNVRSVMSPCRGIIDRSTANRISPQDPDVEPIPNIMSKRHLDLCKSYRE